MPAGEAPNNVGDLKRLFDLCVEHYGKIPEEYRRLISLKPVHFLLLPRVGKSNERELTRFVAVSTLNSRSPDAG